ncbi:MAG: tetratricopeptide repeat protein [Isosphaeraceae bacterium]
MRRLGAALLVLAALAALVVAGGWAYRAWRAQSLADSAREAMDRGDHALAADRFADALSYRPTDDEYAYLLGFCEQARGRLDEAARAWERVGDRSPFAAPAAAKLAPLVLERGRYDRAEALLRRALATPGPHTAGVREMLARALRFQDRRDEAREVLRDELRLAPDPVRVLRDLYLLDHEGFALDRTRALFDQAAKDAPDDDRVRLALANLDRRAGRLDAAEKSLRECLERRPDDPAVWRAWLAWARDAGRADEVRKALPHLPARRFRPPEVLDLRAWLARQDGDAAAERRALESLAATDPAWPGALDRLAELDALEGRADRAAEHRRVKAGLDRDREQYSRLFDEPDQAARRRRPTMARLAESLGRRDEARGWWMLVLRSKPADVQAREAHARLDRDPAGTPKAEKGAGTLADLLADLAPPRPPAQAAAGPVASTVAPRFVDDAEKAGLRFVFDQGQTPDRQLPETMSGGVGLIDHDGDGRLDVYCVQGGPLVPGSGARRRATGSSATSGTARLKT